MPAESSIVEMFAAVGPCRFTGTFPCWPELCPVEPKVPATLTLTSPKG